jgi:hypothetical protein
MSDAPQPVVIVGGYTLPVVGTYEGDRRLFDSDVPEMTMPELLAEKERVRRALTEAPADELAWLVTTVDHYVKLLDQPATVRHWLLLRDAQIAHVIQNRSSREVTRDAGDGPAEAQ